MGEIVEIQRYASARDRKLLGEILQSAQLAQAFAAYERSYFMSSPEDQRKIAERIAEMGRDAGKLSGAFRERTAEIPWQELVDAAAKARTDSVDPAELWTTVKRVVPRITSALAPLAGDAGGVFAWTPPPKAKRAAKSAAAKPREEREANEGRR